MMMMMIALLTALTTPALAGPWIHDLGAGYLEAGYAHFTGAERYTTGLPTGRDHRSDSATFYAEAGLGAGFQAVASLPWVRAVNESSGGVRYTNAWTGDLRLELDWGPRLAIPLAAGLEVRLPTYRDPSEHDRVRDIEDELLPSLVALFPDLGDANVDLLPKLMIGGAPMGGDAWVALQVGSMIRLGSYDDSLWGALDAGIWLADRRLALAAYASGNKNYARIASYPAAREILYLRGKVLAPLAASPGLLVQVFGGGVPAAADAQPGWDVGAALAYRFGQE